MASTKPQNARRSSVSHYVVQEEMAICEFNRSTSFRQKPLENSRRLSSHTRNKPSIKISVYHANNYCIMSVLSIKIGSGARSQFMWTWCVIPLNVSSVGFTMFERRGTLWNEKKHFPICRCRTRTGWKKTSRRAYCRATRNAYIIKVYATKASVIIVGKHFSFAAMTIAACTPNRYISLHENFRPMAESRKRSHTFRKPFDRSDFTMKILRIFFFSQTI